MNLHALAAGAIGLVNPPLMATLHRSAGYATEPDGTRVPRFQQPVEVAAQVQPLTYKDLQQVEGLNLTGQAVSIYITGRLQGTSRPDRKGGDVVDINGTRWLVVQVVEDWPDWVKVVAVRQVPDGPVP